MSVVKIQLGLDWVQKNGLRGIIIIMREYGTAMGQGSKVNGQLFDASPGSCVKYVM